MAIEIITDKKDNKKYAKVPLRKWNAMQKELQKSKFLTNLQTAVNEVKLIEAGKIKGTSLDEFLKSI